MPATCRAPRRAVPPRQDRCRWCDRPPWCRHGGERRQHQARRSAARRWTAGTVASSASIKSPARRSTASRSMPVTCRAPRTCLAAAPGPLPVARSAARPLMPARWRAAPRSRPAIGREALDAPCRCAGTVAGGAIGRKARDAGMVASGAGIKPGGPGEALHRDARCARCRRRAAPLDVPCRYGRTVAGGALGREPLDAGTVASIKAGDRPRGPRCRHAVPCTSSAHPCHHGE
jgi:hypothetical protein